MLAIRIVSAAIVLSVATSSSASEPNTKLTEAHERYRAGDFDGALQRLEPLLKAADLEQTLKVRVRELATSALQLRGEERFRKAQVAESVADFDRQVQLQPDRAAEHWQRGIAYYYLGKYEEGARQFKLHQTVNPQDVENAAWHFACVARTAKQSVETARKSLIPVTGDSRAAMAQIHQMFAGTITPDEVLKVGEKAGGTAKFYADFYVGLYYEVLNRNDESLRLLRFAANNSSAKNNYMRDVAQVHVTLRTKKGVATRRPLQPQ